MIIGYLVVVLLCTLIGYLIGHPLAGLVVGVVLCLLAFGAFWHSI